MSQTTFDNEIGSAHPGLLADVGAVYVRSMKNEESSALDRGLGVQQGTAADEILLLTADADIFLGVTVHDHNSAYAGDEAVPAGDLTGVAITGPVYVYTEAAVSAGDPVFCRHTSGTGTVIGAFRNDADTASCKQIEGAHFLTDGAADGQAVVNLPGFKA